MPTGFLVADDDEDIRFFISYVLERAGHEVAVTGDGAEALARAAGEEFDLVVLDHHMPRMTGLEVAAQLRVLRPAARVLLMSGDLDVGEQCPYFLPKPFDRKELTAAVTRLLEDA
ncbi:response regulator [Nocardioides xinjiangensis]|uniref:response regulator n=1 Tax=Nocardioides xinjiangensis TaxID=2817376 RepID=UPI001B3076B5|nr:response regulator [Nocardioides sp. SYSU D00778]